MWCTWCKGGDSPDLYRRGRRRRTRVAFKVAPNPDGTWTQSVLYRITGGADGAIQRRGCPRCGAAISMARRPKALPQRALASRMRRGVQAQAQPGRSLQKDWLQSYRYSTVDDCCGRVALDIQILCINRGNPWVGCRATAGGAGLRRVPDGFHPVASRLQEITGPSRPGHRTRPPG